MRSVHRQGGVTLVIALLLLAILSLLGASAVTNSSMNVRITANMEAYQDVEAAAQDGIEQQLSSIAAFNDPQPATVTVEGISVTVAAARCLDTRPADGYSAVFPMAPEETVWEIEAEAVDSVTGARAQTRQGLAITMVADSCP